MKPRWHYRPEDNWINDPNGLVQDQGWYHMFYQYNPHGDAWGDIHWGHARSKDLLHWETLPVALAPDADRGEMHCFSGGCCKDEAGRPHFFYTSIGRDEEGRDCTHGAQQWMADPADEDLRTLVQTDAHALTDAIHGGMHVRDWRDPCVLRHEGQYLMVLGGSVDARGCILLYTSPDMKTWTYRHILAISDRADGVPWECPNLFPLDGKWGLIYSPCAEVRVKLGTLDGGLCFHEEREEIVDPAARDGFYAPQVFRDEAGRTILIGWMPECDNVPHKGWSGVMSLPRVLTLNADGLHAAPIPGAEHMPGVRRQKIARSALPCTWTLHRSADGLEETLLTLDADGMLTLDRSRSCRRAGPNVQAIRRRVPLHAENDVFLAVDGSAVECAVNGKWLSGRIYPEAEDTAASDARLIGVRPSARQLAMQKREMYAFVHFTVNTFTDREWGDGTESPAVFAPARLDATQWVEAVKAAGMRALIFTCKHHDGFCLWPSRHTDHTVAASPYRDGQGDVVREVAEACRAGGIGFGVYLSPWDRHSALYGQGKPYDDYFVAQLTEVLTQYGDVCSVWLDGAFGEGPNGRKQHYDWARYCATIRALQPDACIHVCGPDVRWCGNEAGDARDAEWSVVPRRTMDTEKVASLSQHADDPAFRQRRISAQDLDLGSRAILAEEPDLIWYPAEVNTSIRPGWFWHAAEDDRVRPLEELIQIYEHSVGGNATFLLNIPPTSEGLFHETDVQRLQAFGAYLADAYGEDLMQRGDMTLTADTEQAPSPARSVLAEDESCWMPEGGSPWTITAAWMHPVTFRRVVLQEQICLSQRVERFAVDIRQSGAWRTIAEGRVIGYKKILAFPPTEAEALRVRILDARVAPTLRRMQVFI